MLVRGKFGGINEECLIKHLRCLFVHHHELIIGIGFILFLKHVKSAHHPLMLGDDLLALCGLLDPLDISAHQTLDLSPLESELIRRALRVKAKCAGCIRLLIALTIVEQFLPFVLAVSEDTSDEGLNFTRSPW